MRKLLTYIFAISCLVTSCEIDSLDNGQLNGFWYLVQVDSLDNGLSRPYRDNKVFWAVQGKLLMAYRYDVGGPYGMDRIYFRFEQKDSKLRLYSPYRYNRKDGEEGDIPLTADSLYLIQPLGVNSVDESFDVEALNSDAMILKGKSLRLNFERY